MPMASRPLLIQSDGTIMLQDHHPDADSARELLRDIGELKKRPGEWHTYQVTSVSLWNAAAFGWTADTVMKRLESLARYGVPSLLEKEIRLIMGRYGNIRLRPCGEELELSTGDSALLMELARTRSLKSCWIGDSPDGRTLRVKREARGWLKRELIALGYPVMDEVGYRSGESLPVALLDEDESGQPIRLRAYQAEAVEAFASDKIQSGGSGVVVLPCGAGKTWVGMGALAKLQCETLILTSNALSVSQWIRELLRNTSLTENDVGEYTGDRKNVKPVTVATYQVLTHRKSKNGAYPHWKLFVDRNWGLIIYDEVHLLPAPVFRMTADLQATRRLGLTATLVREDGREGDVFALIGPKSYDAPWRSMEQLGWIAKPSCLEVRVPMAPEEVAKYLEAPKRQKHRIAGENPLKLEAVRRLLSRHPEQPTLIIGQYLDQLNSVARGLRLPIITGSTPQPERQRLFDRFNRGEISVLAVSKVANFAVDLPDASIAIQISGSFGSRQEEAQRLGRILRPKREGTDVFFYSLVSDETDEVEFARRRQRFLLEQGYEYEIDWMEEAAEAGEEAIR